MTFQVFGIFWTDAVCCKCKIIWFELICLGTPGDAISNRNHVKGLRARGRPRAKSDNIAFVNDEANVLGRRDKDKIIEQFANRHKKGWQVHFSTLCGMRPYYFQIITRSPHSIYYSSKKSLLLQLTGNWGVTCHLKVRRPTEEETNFGQVKNWILNTMDCRVLM